MIYSIVTTEKFDKSFRKLDRQVQKMIKRWICKNLKDCQNPRIHGKPLSANFSGIWRYRIGDYRLLVEINDNQFLIIAIEIGHRKEIYK